MKQRTKAESPFIPLREAAELLNLDESSVRKGAAGTEELTKVRQGNRVFLMRAQLMAHIRNLTEAAQRQYEKPLERVFPT